MIAGYVYILINPCMPGIVKIGHSIRLPEDRAKEVSQGTGVPAPFTVAWYEAIGRCDEVEQAIHARLDKFRFNQGREFFAMPLRDAIDVTMQVVAEFREQEKLMAEEASLNAEEVSSAQRSEETSLVLCSMSAPRLLGMFAFPLFLPIGLCLVFPAPLLGCFFLICGLVGLAAWASMPFLCPKCGKTSVLRYSARTHQCPKCNATFLLTWKGWG